jgi:galactose mutarotase-like enzyme
VAHARGGNPILFPFVARHYVDGELGKWRDANGVVREMPMHGFAREMPFEIVEQSAKVLRMRLTPTAQTHEYYPFDWTFDVIYELNGSTLRLSFETENRGEERMPYYPGHHFYFAVDHTQRDAWTIDTPCQTWGRIDSAGTLNFEAAQEVQTTLSDPNLVDRFHLDFTQPCVTLTNKATDQTIDIGWEPHYSSLWKDVTTWTQSNESDFFCVEPWLGLPNAIHHGHGLRWLEPGRWERAACFVRAC